MLIGNYKDRHVLTLLVMRSCDGYVGVARVIDLLYIHMRTSRHKRRREVLMSWI